MWPSDLTSAMTLTLNFQGQTWNLLYLSKKWSDCHETKNQTHWLNCRPQMWPLGLTLAMTLILNFQGQISNLLHLSQKWCDCHETKSKHIDWSQGLKYDHQVWPWPWPWPWILTLYGICYSSAKNGPIPTKWKANISIELSASNVTIRFDLDHDIDLEFSRSNMEFPISQPKVVQLPWNEKQTYWLNSRCQMWPMGLTFEFSRSNVILTIWWPRSGVRI